MTAYDRLQKARAIGRPTAAAFIDAMFTGFMELSGDRAFAEDKAVRAGLAWLGDMPVTVISLEKGVSTEDKIERNFGSAHPEGYRKALRLMKQAEKFQRPVFCIVDTSGAFCGTGAEERGQGEAIARNIYEMSALKTPIISLLISEGGSGGALALAVADEVWMLENAVYSVISPEGAASIIWKNSEKTREAADSMRITAADMLAFGVADRVFEEPQSFEPLYAQLREALYAAFSEKLADAELLQRRTARFRRIGAV